MKNLLFMLGLAVAVGACDTGQVGEDALAPAPPQHVMLVLRGIGASDYANVLLDVKDVRVTADGRPVAVTPPQMRFDLANPVQGWNFGELEVPATTQRVHVTMTFDDFGGFEGAAGAGEIDARVHPIEIDASMADLQLRGKILVNLNVARSLIATGTERRLLLPSLSVAY
jgi:hypothetical protein